MAAQTIPKEPTIREMKQKAEECDYRAHSEPEPHASKLKEKAALIREWIKVLKAGGWTS
jgi:hypothetical protein